MIALDRDAMRVNVSAYEPGSGFYEIWTQEPEPGPCPPSVREALGKASQTLKQYNLASKRRHVLQEWYVERLKDAGFINCHTPRTPKEWARAANEILDDLEEATVNRVQGTWGDHEYEVQIGTPA